MNPRYARIMGSWLACLNSSSLPPTKRKSFCLRTPTPYLGLLPLAQRFHDEGEGEHGDVHHVQLLKACEHAAESLAPPKQSLHFVAALVGVLVLLPGFPAIFLWRHHRHKAQLPRCTGSKCSIFLYCSCGRVPGKSPGSHAPTPNPEKTSSPIALAPTGLNVASNSGGW